MKQTNYLQNRIAAGIVTFNPDIIRLQENIDAVSSQVEKIFIFDNGSSNFSAINTLCGRYGHITLICSSTNQGIAYALNRLFENAQAEKFDWLLTLDQDSVCFPDLVNQYRRHLDDAESLCCFFRDESIQSEFVEYCITSGNLVKIKSWETIHGFNENLFIDMVDVDFCYRLIRNHFNILRIPYCGFQHQMGDGTYWNFLGHKIFVGNYSPFRKYYIFRNMIYVMRKYHLNLFHHFSYKRLCALFLHTILYETEKRKKVNSMMKGFLDGFRKYEWIDSYWDQNQP